LLLLVIFTLLPSTSIITLTAATSLRVSISVSPIRIHEGKNTTITVKIQQAPPNQNLTLGVNVTNPSGSSSVANITVNSDDEGSGNSSIRYWRDFAQANTDLVGEYIVRVKNLTTDKIMATATFFVEIWRVQVWAGNLANESIEGLLIRAQNITAVPERFSEMSDSTNKTGWASFMLAKGKYNLGAFWKGIPVGNQTISVMDDDKVSEVGWIQLSNLEITVVEKVTNKTVPFVKLSLKYGNITERAETNVTGTEFVHNLIVGVNYTLNVERHELKLPISFQIEISNQSINRKRIELPAYTLLIHVEDSKGNPAGNVEIRAYEWSSGLGEPANSTVTDPHGNATLSLIFGKYRIWAYNGTILIHETTLNLDQQKVLHILIQKIDLTVQVLDYFGQPIPNAEVRVYQQKTAVSIKATTDPNGEVAFLNVLAGDSQISVYVREQLGGVKLLHLTNSKLVRFRLDRYVIVAGYPMETSQFVTAIAIILFVAAFAIALSRRPLSRILKRRK
jgi:5-hydroxyisourate hydrolase-like protein (transthyretin family)